MTDAERQPGDAPGAPLAPRRFEGGWAGARSAGTARGGVDAGVATAADRPGRVSTFLGRDLVRFVAGIIVGVLMLAALRWSGTTATTAASLVEMGFDPDRAELITALVAAAIAAAAAAFLVGRRLSSLVIGLGGTAALFGPTFAQETSAAQASSGAQGTFDPLGWAAALVTLVASGLIVGWAAGTLALDARGGLLAAGRAAGGLVTHRSRNRDGWQIARAVGVIALLAVALPVFGQMVNYSPDATMRQGGPTGVPLTGGGSSPGASDDPNGGVTAGSPVPSAVPSPGEAGLVKGPFPGSVVSRGAVATARPWLAVRPSGPSRVVANALPAPWVGGTSSRIFFDVYLPPGYSSSLAAGYPAVYVTPWGLAHWEDSIHLRETLDALITGGRIPPQVFVFVSQFGAPFPASECADSFDGRQRLDTWIGTTLVKWIDSHYNTIVDRQARSLLGYSEGGYCATALLLHHPDVFGQAAAMSGYYVAGPHFNQTINSWRVFGDDATAKANASPLLLVDRLSATQRSSIFIALNGQPAEPLFGPQYRAFSTKLAHDQVPMALLPTSRTGHSWQEVRDDIGSMLELLAGHLVATGVFT